MRLKLKMSKDVDICIMYMIIFQAFLGNFLGLSDILNKVICLFVIARLSFLVVSSRLRNTNAVKCLTVLVIWILVAVCNAIVLRSYAFFLPNLLSLVYTISAFAFLCYLQLQKESRLMAFLNAGFPIINIYAVVNCLIVYIQAQGNGFLIDMSRTSNQWYIDHIAGLQGLDGTQRLTLIWTFIVFYNYVYSTCCAPQKRKRIIAYNILLMLITLLLSTMNDSKFYFFLLPLMIVEFYLMTAYWKKTLTTKMVVLSCITLLVLFVFNHFEEYLLSVMGEAGQGLSRAIDSMLNIDFADSRKNNERVSILIYTFNNGNFWGLGKGIGEYSFYSSATAYGMGKGQTGGYWGTSNLGPFLYAFGFFVTLGLNTLSACLISTVLSKKNRLEIIPFFMAFITLLVLMFFNKIYTLQSFMIDFMLIVLVFCAEKKIISNSRNG